MPRERPLQTISQRRALADDLDRYLGNQPIHARRTPFLERGLKWVRRRPAVSSLLATVCLIAALYGLAAIRSSARLKAELDRDEAILSRLGNDLIDGRYPDAELDRLMVRTESDYRLAGVHARALEMFKEANRRAEEKQSREVDRERLREFLRCRDDALFQDTQLTGLDPSENVTVVRKSSRAALRLFATDARRDNQWALKSLPQSWTQQERESVIMGCYEMLMIRPRRSPSHWPANLPRRRLARRFRSWNLLAFWSVSRPMLTT